MFYQYRRTTQNGILFHHSIHKTYKNPHLNTIFFKLKEEEEVEEEEEEEEEAEEDDDDDEKAEKKKRRK